MPVENPQNLRKIMTAPENGAVHRDNDKCALFASKFRTLLDPINWHLGRPAKNTEYGGVGKAVDSVIAPLACSNELAIKSEDSGQFGPCKRYSFGPRRLRYRRVFKCHTQTIAQSAEPRKQASVAQR